MFSCLFLYFQKLYHSIIDALCLMGRDVLDCGIIPTPTAQFIIKENKLAGGIVITASHNPIEWNGLKFLDKDGCFINKDKMQILLNYSPISSTEYKGTIIESGNIIVDWDTNMLDADKIEEDSVQFVNYPAKPLLYSLLLPGLGQYKNGDPLWKSAIFAGVEVASIIGWVQWNKQAEDIRMQTFIVDEHVNGLPACQMNGFTGGDIVVDGCYDPAESYEQQKNCFVEAEATSFRNLGLCNEGEALVLQALHSRRFGPYSLQAAIAAVHAEAASLEETDWAQIVGLYDELLRLNPSPVVALNRAVALAMHEGEEVGLMEVERLLASGELDGYHLLHAARADLLRRLGRTDQAIAAYRQALALAQQGADRQFLQKRLEELGSL